MINFDVQIKIKKELKFHNGLKLIYLKSIYLSFLFLFLLLLLAHFVQMLKVHVKQSSAFSAFTLGIDNDRDLFGSRNNIIITSLMLIIKL